MRWKTAVSLVAPLLLAACVEDCPITPQGGTLELSGPASEEVRAQVTSFPRPCCRADQGCFEERDVFLDPTGFARIEKVVDGVDWIAIGIRTFCAGVGHVPCNGTGSVQCVAPVGPVAVGEITIVGPGVDCEQFQDEMPPVGQEPQMIEVCNATTVTVEINGISVSMPAGKNSTASSVAFALSNKINNKPALHALVGVVAAGNTIIVRAWQEGFEHIYPWNSSCSYTQEFFSECAFEAKRSPNATLGVSPPL